MLIPVAILATGVPRVAAPQASPPTFQAEAQVVLLDLVAKDGKGRPVTDLRADELQVFEDGRRCEVQSFRLVRAASAGAAGPAAASAQPTTSPPQPEPAAPSRANLVVLLFDRLLVGTAPYARQGALDLLGRSFPPNTWFAVFKVYTRGTRVLQPFTSDRDRLRTAVVAATTGDDARSAVGTAPAGESGQQPAASSNPIDTPPSSAGLLQPPSFLRDIAAGAEGSLRELMNRVQAFDTFYGIQAITRSLAAVRGRKAIVYFAEDHELSGDESGGGGATLVYEATMSDANRANVTIHTVDARGLTARRIGGQGGFEQAIAQFSAAGQTGGGRGAIGNTSSAAATEYPDMGGGPIRSGMLALKSGSLLEHVAEDTGGLAIRNTNDLGAGLASVIDELREYYEVVYTPPNPVPDGRFRRIQAKVTRSGVQVRTRAGYFATPATTPTLAAFELTLIAALIENDPPHAFDHLTRLVPHALRGGDREVEFLAEVPLSAIEVATDAAHGIYTAHLSFLAFIKDETGRAVVRLSQDWPIERKLDEAGGTTQANAVLRRVLSLPPGRYTVESAVQDRTSGRISVVRMPSDIAPAPNGTSVPSAATPAPSLPGPQPTQVARPDGQLGDILRRAGDYVVEYERVFSDLVAEETYTQEADRQVYGAQSYSLAVGPPEAVAGRARASLPYTYTQHNRQVTRADLVFVRLAGALPWASYRDVSEVNGRKVREHEERLLALFSKPSADVHERARALLVASAEYNIGRVTRTMNLPTLPLLFLLPANQSRFTFELGTKQTIGSTETVEVLFREVARPTLVSGPKGADLPTSGRFWIHPGRGTVVRSEVRLDFGPEAEAVVSTEYRPESALAMWVPAEMKERYADVPNAKVRTFPDSFTGVARYGKFRRFTVRSEEGATVAQP
jgi:VWFA-related protein